MIDVSTDTVQRLAALAREIHSGDAVTLPEDTVNPSGDLGVHAITGQARDMCAAEFRSIIEDLEPDQQQQVVALTWLGRGDFSADEWDEARELAEQRWSEETADYLLTHPMLAEELSAGLDALGFETEEA
jgi:hypothetical protein